MAPRNEGSPEERIRIQPSGRRKWPGCLVVALLLVSVSWFLWERAAFVALRVVQDDPQWARPIAGSLSRSRQGLELALQDINVLGGTTKGWSSWILCYSSRADMAMPMLTAVADSPQAARSKRMEAVIILWRRTHDRSHLERLYAMVRPADSSPTVLVARLKLWSFLGAPDELAFLEKEPETASLSMNENQFAEALARILPP